VTEHQQKLINHWTKYLPMHFHYITQSIREHFDRAPHDKEVIKPLLDPVWLSVKQSLKENT
jgi:hypothetical protein